MEFIKYPKIKELEEVKEILNSSSLSIFEKIDGANCQIRKIQGKLLCGNRSRYLTGKNLCRKWFIDFRNWVFSNSELWDLDENIILFGEWTSIHTIEYSPVYTNQFFLIDIYDINQKKFWEYTKASEYVLNKKIPVKTLNILYSGKADLEFLKKLVLKKSDYYDGPMEGIVIKDYKNQFFAKFYHPNFQETNWEGKTLEEKYLTLRKFQKIVLDISDDPIIINKIKKGEIKITSIMFEKICEEVKYSKLSKDEIKTALNSFISSHYLWIQKKIS